MDAETLKAKLSEIFEEQLQIDNERAANLVPETLTKGKAYEAYVLGTVCEKLTTEEGCELTLVNGSKLVLKSSGGPINQTYPWIEVRREGTVIGEIYTDIEFMSQSFRYVSNDPVDQHRLKTEIKGYYHELDILMVKPNPITGHNGRPLHDQILIGVECKNTKGYSKSLLKEILGVRREMGLISSQPIKTIFQSWPASAVRIDSGSCLLVYSQSENTLEYSGPGRLYEIQFEHDELSDFA